MKPCRTRSKRDILKYSHDQPGICALVCCFFLFCDVIIFSSGGIELKKYTPYAKLSKKQKRALDQQKRVTWRISPITRRPENPKAYQRKKARQWMNESSDVLFFISLLLNKKP